MTEFNFKITNKEDDDYIAMFAYHTTYAYFTTINWRLTLRIVDNFTENINLMAMYSKLILQWCLHWKSLVHCRNAHRMSQRFVSLESISIHPYVWFDIHWKSHWPQLTMWSSSHERHSDWKYCELFLVVHSDCFQIPIYLYRLFRKKFGITSRSYIMIEFLRKMDKERPSLNNINK